MKLRAEIPFMRLSVSVAKILNVKAEEEINDQSFSQKESD